MTRTLCIVLGIALCATAAQAYSAKQAMECYPDAVRLCGAPPAVGAWKKLSGSDHAKIITCMILHAGALSPRCLKAFGK